MRFLVCLLVWFLLMTSFGNSSTALDDSDCLEWSYEPQFDFLGPQFEKVAKNKQVVIGKEQRWSLPEEFHAPQFEQVQKQPALLSMPDEFHAPQFEAKKQSSPEQDWELVGEFHAPQFEAKQQAPMMSEQDWELVGEFHAPQFEAKQTAQQPSNLPEEFYAPPFEVTPQQLPAQDWNMPEEFYAPQFEIKQQVQPRSDEADWELPSFHAASVKDVQQPVVKKEHVQDSFSNGVHEKTVVKPVREHHHSKVKVHDEFSAVGEEVGHKKKHLVEPKKKYSPSKHDSSEDFFRDSYKPKASVHDSFSGDVSHKTIVKPIHVLPDEKAKIHDGFVAVIKEEKEPEKKVIEVKKPVEDAASYYDSGPLTGFFLDLIGAEAPVHDSFSGEVSDKTIVEPVREYPEPKAEVHDEFTALGDDYRLKRSVKSSPVSSNDTSVLWKLVCLKRRSKPLPTPVARTLTASDFIEYAKTANEHIQRCIGRKEGESIAAGSCRKHYLRCAPSISVLLCPQLGEVFSAVENKCVPKSEVHECNIRPLKASKIGLSSTKEKEFDATIGDFNVSCLNKKDGFYQDPKNCSRVLQCFDQDLFEYPSCGDRLVFDAKQGVCDYREKVSSCSN